MIKQTDLINIMTSCDQNLIQYMYIQLKSISQFFDKKKIVHFYLFQSKVSEESINDLKKYCEFLENITFHNIVVEDTTSLDIIASIGGNWPSEAYFPLVCHQYLPETVERILYIDAGDVLFYGVNKNIDEYYNCDFEENLLYVTLARSKTQSLFFQPDDLANIDNLKIIARGLFNSGSYMINVKGFREQGVLMKDMVELSNMLNDIIEDETKYFGDQGFFSLAFIGKIKYFHEDFNVCFMPYNFCLWLFDIGLQKLKELWYEPKIIHFVGAEKPWNIPTLTSPKIKNGQFPFYRYYKHYERIVDNELQSIGIYKQ